MGLQARPRVLQPHLDIFGKSCSPLFPAPLLLSPVNIPRPHPVSWPTFSTVTCGSLPLIVLVASLVSVTWKCGT